MDAEKLQKLARTAINHADAARRVGESENAKGFERYPQEVQARALTSIALSLAILAEITAEEAVE